MYHVVAGGRSTKAARTGPSWVLTSSFRVLRPSSVVSSEISSWISSLLAYMSCWLRATTRAATTSGALLLSLAAVSAASGGVWLLLVVGGVESSAACDEGGGWAADDSVLVGAESVHPISTKAEMMTVAMCVRMRIGTCPYPAVPAAKAVLMMRPDAPTMIAPRIPPMIIFWPLLTPAARSL